MTPIKFSGVLQWYRTRGVAERISSSQGTNLQCRNSNKAFRPFGTLRTGRDAFGRPGVLSPTTILRAGGTGAAIHRGEGMRTQFGLWTSRAWGFLVDALAYSRHVMALGSGRTHLEALPMPDEPLLSWSVYLADAPAKWLGTVEAPTAEEAVKIGAEKFGHDAKRLMAVRRR